MILLHLYSDVGDIVIWTNMLVTSLVLWSPTNEPVTITFRHQNPLPALKQLLVTLLEYGCKISFEHLGDVDGECTRK